jgi:hypothetical protein
LQLVCLNLFYEHIQLDMPCRASEPTSKPVQPQELVFYAPGPDFKSDSKSSGALMWASAPQSWVSLLLPR